MILPIVAYGDPVLKTKGVPIEKDFLGLAELISNMWETMYNASGVGLAAHQIGKSIRLFIVDASPFEEDDSKLKDFKKVFINPQIVEEWGDEWRFNEGCLSFPELREDISRKPNIRITYLDEKFEPKEEVYDGLAARIIQHEYDHIEGIVMPDRMTPLKRTLLRNRLQGIARGAVRPDYPMKFAIKK
jgi:peptide deformylase